MRNLGAYLFLCTLSAAAQPPAIFYTDLTSGPNTGGENNNGTILTIYGKRFGPTQLDSTVTVGAGAVAAYLSWSDTRIAVAIGPAAATGDVVVSTAESISNIAPFTVRDGNIYCVSPAGSDTASGAFPACWATLPKAQRSMAPGDITYALDGVTQNAADAAKATLYIGSSGTAGMPKALVAYPGAAVVVGIADWGTDKSNPIRDGVRVGASHWVLAGLFLQGVQALDFAGAADDWRVVGNELTCPNGSAEMPPGWPTGYEGFGCATSADATHVAFLGNYVHDTGVNCWTLYPQVSDGCKLYHAVYFSTNSNHLEVGWNTIVPNGGCRALQFHSSSGANMYDLVAHDNIIHDSVCDGINFATVDPSQGAVAAYNNVIYNAGMGPDPSGQVASYACIYSADITNQGAPGAGLIRIFNNTLYNCGARDNRQAAFAKNGANPNLTMFFENNIVYQADALFVAGPAAQMSGANNLWFGPSNALPGWAGDSQADPQFVDAANYDFHLQANSPAIGAGTSLAALLSDLDGIARPRDMGYDLGAYQYEGSGQ